MRGDRNAGRPVGLCGCPENPLDILCHARLVRRALDDSRSNAGVHDPILDVLDEQLSDVIDAPAGGRAEMVWYLPVNSGGHDDLHSAARDHVLHKRDVPPVAGC